MKKPDVNPVATTRAVARSKHGRTAVRCSTPRTDCSSSAGTRPRPWRRSQRRRGFGRDRLQGVR